MVAATVFRRRDADHLGDDAADLGRGVELPLALAALGGEVAHQVFVGVAQDVVGFSSVFWRNLGLGRWQSDRLPIPRARRRRPVCWDR